MLPRMVWSQLLRLYVNFTVIITVISMKVQIFIATIPLVSDHLPSSDMSGPVPYGTVPRLTDFLRVCLSSNGSFYRDNLVGTAVYGVYASDPLAPTAFSVGFSAFKSTPILFMTGDYSQRLVLQYGDILMSTNASAVNVTRITHSTTNCELNAFFCTFSLIFLL